MGNRFDFLTRAFIKSASECMVEFRKSCCRKIPPSAFGNRPPLKKGVKSTVPSRPANAGRGGAGRPPLGKGVKYTQAKTPP